MPRRDDREAELMEITGTYLRPAGGAVVIEDADGKEHLLPRSQITLNPEDPDEYDIIVVTLPEWLAVKEGLA